MSDLATRVAANLASIQDRIVQASVRSGRDPQSVRLIAVTKYAAIPAVQALIEAGQRRLGESRPQQLAERAERIDRNVEWHLIGHLQRNKVRSVLPCTEMIHSVDSLRLARRLSQVGQEMSLAPRILLEVNVSGEKSKDGFDADELETIWPNVRALPWIRIEGLMTMARASRDPDSARPTFRALRVLRDRLRDQAKDLPLPELSMGMSGDFEIAIEEGATLVRIGSALFEGTDS